MEYIREEYNRPCTDRRLIGKINRRVGWSKILMSSTGEPDYIETLGKPVYSDSSEGVLTIPDILYPIREFPDGKSILWRKAIFDSTFDLSSDKYYLLTVEGKFSTATTESSYVRIWISQAEDDNMVEYASSSGYKRSMPNEEDFFTFSLLFSGNASTLKVDIYGLGVGQEFIYRNLKLYEVGYVED